MTHPLSYDCCPSMSHDHISDELRCSSQECNLQCFYGFQQKILLKHNSLYDHDDFKTIVKMDMKLSLVVVP